MLYEIYCDKFKSNGLPRGPIRFHNGLNVVKGHDSGTNSIGKSTFLLAVDFAFGGEDYAKDDTMITKIGHHTVQFAFCFNGETYYFSRNTSAPSKVNICDSDYTVKETITTEKFLEKLFTLYGITLPKISFRGIVGRYFRVYGRGNSDEKQPLASYVGEPEKDSLINLLKLFDRYMPVEEHHTKLQESEAHREAIKNAEKFQLVKLIHKVSEYESNLSEIEKLQTELDVLTKYGRQDMLYLAPAQAEKAAEYKARYEALTRKKKQLWVRYYAIKNNLEKARPTTTQDFEMLLRFFPNSDIRQIGEIEHFHAKLNDILNEEFQSSMREILADIDELSAEIESLEALIREYDLPKRISDSTLKSYAQKQNRINELTKQNELYKEKQQLDKTVKELKAQYEKLFLDAFQSICNDINNVMEKLNEYIYGHNIVSPTLSITKSNAYQFGTDVDHGTGTNYKNLILLDFASLRLTQLPTFAHDTILFHNIGQEPMAKILELYNACEKQVFIAIDETSKFADSAQQIINDNTVIELSGNGNELFGSSWIEKQIEN